MLFFLLHRCFFHTAPSSKFTDAECWGPNLEGQFLEKIMFCLLGGNSIVGNLYRPKKISRHKFLARCRTVPTHMSHAAHFWQTGSWTIRTTTNKCIFPVEFTSLTQTKSWYFHHPSALLTDWQWNYLHYYKSARKSRFYLHRRGGDTQSAFFLLSTLGFTFLTYNFKQKLLPLVPIYLT